MNKKVNEKVYLIANKSFILTTAKNKQFSFNDAFMFSFKHYCDAYMRYSHILHKPNKYRFASAFKSVFA